MNEQIESRLMKRKTWKRIWSLERRLQRGHSGPWVSCDWRDTTLGVIRERQRQDPLRWTFVSRLRDVTKLHADRKLHEAVRHQIKTLAPYLSNDAYAQLMELERVTARLVDRKLLILGGEESDTDHKLRKALTRLKYIALRHGGES